MKLMFSSIHFPIWPYPPSKIQGDGRKYLDRFKSYFGSQISSQSLNEVHIYRLQPNPQQKVIFCFVVFCIFLSLISADHLPSEDAASGIQSPMEAVDADDQSVSETVRWDSQSPSEIVQLDHDMSHDENPVSRIDSSAPVLDVNTADVYTSLGYTNLKCESNTKEWREIPDFYDRIYLKTSSHHRSLNAQYTGDLEADGDKSATPPRQCDAAKLPSDALLIVNYSSKADMGESCSYNGRIMQL